MIGIFHLLLNKFFMMLCLALCSAAFMPVWGEESAGHSLSEETLVLPVFNIKGQQVANESSAHSLDMPVSALALNPLVDVQSRGFAEGAADIMIRGGTFESISFQIGVLSVYDPQTGHYFAELPIDPQMLGSGLVRSGSELAMSGWNSTAAGIAYEWQEIRRKGRLVLAAGENDFIKGQLYLGEVARLSAEWRLGADISVAHSQANSSLPHSEHDISRYNVRLQLLSENSQSDIFVGYQEKFIAMQNLYAGPFNSPESDEIRTLLFMASHEVHWDKDRSWFRMGAYYRRNDDCYQYNRFEPNQDYVHRSQVYGVSFDGCIPLENSLSFRYRGGGVADKMLSSSLKYGRFHTRLQSYLGSWLEKQWDSDGSEQWILSVGGNWNESNRDVSAFSPLFKVERISPRRLCSTVYLSYSETTQLPTYTALNASGTSGIWRGNADLGRSFARNWELGWSGYWRGWTCSGAFFIREDRDLVDWTWHSAQSPTAARWANAVDMDTFGFEFIAKKSWNRLELLIGYSALRKHEYWGNSSGQVDASFYALNFPEHRITAAVIVRMGSTVELRMDNEGRIQRENALRKSGDKALISALGIYWQSGFFPGGTLGVRVDNLWNSDFEEVPLVPIDERAVSLSVGYTW